MIKAKAAIIGGSGLQSLAGMRLIEEKNITTPYGAPSGPLQLVEFNNCPMVFLARHGAGHTIPPHKINYRANIWALRNLEITNIIAVAAVGGITEQAWPTRLVFPDQIIDYTYLRTQTFFDGDTDGVTHIEFTKPYSEVLRECFIRAAALGKVNALYSAVYGATEGPRLETAAEISRMERDGCNIVGMTGMPEASLAREVGLEYATCAVVANWAAGRNNDVITMEAIEESLAKGMINFHKLLEVLVDLI